MELKTFRAGSMREALEIVRQELGPEAAVLHTREIRESRLFGLLQGKPLVEVTATAGVHVPSRLPAEEEPRAPRAVQNESVYTDPTHGTAIRGGKACNGIDLSAQLSTQLDDLRQMVRNLCDCSASKPQRDLPDSLFRLFTLLIDAEVNDQLARELIERVRSEAPDLELADPLLLQARLSRLIESELSIAGPIRIVPDTTRVAALVGPTGVGKTTTIAKLAANYRLREKRSVGLITVDTYRIAAVEQLRTYADIIDLPMEVVSTPREMREAVKRLSGLDLILMDTAGRSPRDEIKLQELKAFLSEASADEVHLVLSGVAGERTLIQTAQRFSVVGTTSLIFTKLDEAGGLGNLLPVLRESGLPLSYLTNGQNVPDDIETAAADRLADLILDVESSLEPERTCRIS